MVLLTGATGLIGAAIADLLIWYNKDRNVPVELYAAGRNEKQIEEKFKPYEKAAWFHIVPYEASEKINFECPVDYIIHGCGNCLSENVYSKSGRNDAGSIIWHRSDVKVWSETEDSEDGIYLFQ